MTKFIKAIHGNVSAGGKYFMEGAIVPVDDEFASNQEVVSMKDKHFVAIFNSIESATHHTFKSLAQRAKDKENISSPLASNAVVEEIPSPIVVVPPVVIEKKVSPVPEEKLPIEETKEETKVNEETALKDPISELEEKTVTEIKTSENVVPTATVPTSTVPAIKNYKK